MIKGKKVRLVKYANKNYVHTNVWGDKENSKPEEVEVESKENECQEEMDIEVIEEVNKSKVRKKELRI